MRQILLFSILETYIFETNTILNKNITKRRDNMRIGIPKEKKNNENRVSITPAGVLTLVNAGHKVFIEKDAGINSSFTNEAYQNAGAIYC